MLASEGLSRKGATKGLVDFIEIEAGFFCATPGRLERSVTLCLSTGGGLYRRGIMG